MMSEIDLYEAMRWPVETILSNHPGTIGPSLVFGLMAFAGVFLTCLALSFPIALIIGLIGVVIDSSSTLLTPGRFLGASRARPTPVGARWLTRGGKASLGLLARVGTAAAGQARRGARWAGERVPPALAATGSPVLARMGSGFGRIAHGVASAGTTTARLPSDATGQSEAPDTTLERDAPVSPPTGESPQPSGPSILDRGKAAAATVVAILVYDSRAAFRAVRRVVTDFPRFRRKVRRRYLRWHERWDAWRDERAQRRRRDRRSKQRGYYSTSEGRQYYYSRHRRSDRHKSGDAHG